MLTNLKRGIVISRKRPIFVSQINLTHIQKQRFSWFSSDNKPETKPEPTVTEAKIETEPEKS